MKVIVGAAAQKAEPLVPRARLRSAGVDATIREDAAGTHVVVGEGDAELAFQLMMSWPELGENMGAVHWRPHGV